MAAKPRARMFSIQHRSAMNALSLGRNSSLIVSAPGAFQSMAASAHWRSLILSSIASMSMVMSILLGSVRWGRRSVGQADGAGAAPGGVPLDMPTESGIGLRHAIQAAAVVGVEAHARNPAGGEPRPAHQPVGEIGGLLGDSAGFDDVGLDERWTQHGDGDSGAGQFGGQSLGHR